MHLPAGEVDVTLRTAGPAGDVSVPPLSIRIFGPDGTEQPEVIESPRRKQGDSQGNMLVRVWVVRIAQEADYRIEVDGEVDRPYQPPLDVWAQRVERSSSRRWLPSVACCGFYPFLASVVFLSIVAACLAVLARAPAYLS